jgi:hypothetical protein
LEAQFGDSGGYFVLPGEFFVFGWVVGGQVGDWHAEGLEEGSGFGEFIAVNVGFAVGPCPFVSFKGVLSGFVLFADGEPQVRQCAVGDRL